MSILDWFRNEPTQLKLADTGNYGKPKIIMPMVSPLDTSLESLLRYSRRSELVYACIEKKAQSATDAEIVVEKQTADGEWEPVPNHPLVNLLNKPNPWDDGESFMRSWISSENFSDTFYAEIVRSGAGVPVGLYPLNPVNVWPQYDGQGRLLHYLYYVNGREIRYEPKDLMIRHRHGLGSIYSGVSSVAIALGSIDADSAATDYVRAFFNNGGTPSGILINKGRKLSDTDAEAMKQKWTQRYGRGGTSRGGVAIIDAESAEWQSVGSKLTELNSEALDDKAETRICMAFGVPPILIGALAGLRHVTQNATAKAALTDFWINTMSPELKGIRKFLTWNLLPMFESLETIKAGTIRVNWDMSQVGALQDDLDDLAKRAVTIYQGGLAQLNEARMMLKLDAIDGEEGDAFYKAPAPTVNVGNGEKPKEVPPKEMPKHFFNGKLSGVLSAEEIAEYNAHCAEQTADILNAATLEKKSNYWRELTPIEQTIDLKSMVADFDNGKARMTAILLSIRDELIKQSVGAMKQLDGSSIHELTLTPPAKSYSKVRKEIDKLFQTGRDQVADELKRQGKSSSTPDELKKKGDWAAFLDRISDLVISRLISEISTRAINFFVSRGLLDRDDDEIISELRAALEDQSTKTFEDIANQATNSAIGEGRDVELSERADDIEVYEYSAILDGGTCEPCNDADGKQSKDPADLPETPNPDCEGGSRCRCFTIGIGKEENA